MEKRIERFGLWAMGFLAVGVALHAMRYAAVPANLWLGIDEGIRGVIERVPLQALTHMIIAPIALFVGPFQFFTSIRVRRPKLHRTMGKIYVAACTIAGIGGLATAPYAAGGPIAGLGFATLGFLWIVTTLGAWRAAMLGKFDLHRLLMRFSYAMTFGAVTLRLQIPPFLINGFHSYSEASVWLAYTSWIPNVIVVALWSMLAALRQPALAAPE
jgi:uncharacterized membrane protein